MDEEYVYEVPYEVSIVTMGGQLNNVKNDKVSSSTLSLQEISLAEGDVQIVEGSEKFKRIGIRGHNIEDDIKFDIPVGKVLTSKVSSLGGSVISPPWYDCGHGTEEVNFLAFHEEQSSVNCNNGQGYVALAGSCGEIDTLAITEVSSTYPSL